MSITISNLEVIVSPSDNQFSESYIQFRFELNNNTGFDIQPADYTAIMVGQNPGGTSTQFVYEANVPNGSSETILTPRYQTLNPNNSLATFEFQVSQRPWGSNPVITTTVQAADAFIYNPFETRIELENWGLALDPTRTGFPINQNNWYATAEVQFKNYFLEEYQLRKIEIIYDDGSTNEYVLPTDEYLLDPPVNVTDNVSTYIEVTEYPAGASLPLLVRKDKNVSSLRYTLTPSDRWEPYELLASPANVQLNYFPMQLELTTSGNSIFLNVTQGLAPYSYRWNDGTTSQNRENVAPGLYAVTVTDALGYTAQGSVQLGDLHYFSHNPVTLDVNVPDHASKDFLRAVCEVWIERDYGSDSYEKIFEAEQPLDSQGNTLFNFREVLDSFLQPQLPGLTIQRQDHQFTRFYLRFFERYGDPETTGGVTQVQENMLLMGGISELEYARGNFFGLHFAQKPFYSWQPLQKYVAPDQPEYLLFIVNSFDYSQFDVVVKLYYIQPDGSETSSEHVIYSRSSVSKYEPFLFPVGYEQLHLAGYGCSELDRYEVYVKNGPQIVSEIRTYILDYSIHRYRRYFLYQNSLGGWDTLVTTGKAEQSLRIDSETQERYLPPDHGPLERPTEVVSRTASPEVDVSVGYKGKDMMQALQDFMVAREVYTIEKKNDRLELTPVEVDLRSATIHDETETLQTFDFSYRPPRFMQYTPVLLSPANPAIPIEASADVTNDEITLTVSGGTPPYTYAWSDGATSQNRSGLANGEYDVLIRDSQSPAQAYRLCMLTIDFSPVVYNPGAISFDVIGGRYIETPNIYDINAPGYHFQHLDGDLFSTAGIVVFEAQMISQNTEILAGINRFQFSLLLENGSIIAPPASAPLCRVYNFSGGPVTTYTIVQDIDYNLKGTWQQIIIDIDSAAPQTCNIGLNFTSEINNPNDPTFYISDIVLRP